MAVPVRPAPPRSAPSSVLPSSPVTFRSLNEASFSVLSYAERSSDSWVLTTTLADGVAEEVFFRGSLFTALGSLHPVAASTGAPTCSRPAPPAIQPWSLRPGSWETCSQPSVRATGGLSGANPDACDLGSALHAALPPALFAEPSTGAGKRRLGLDM